MLSGHEAAIAKAKGCDPSFIYNIKNGVEHDPYGPFREWFQFAAFGGGAVREYLHDLESIACRAERGHSVERCLTTKLLHILEADSSTAQLLVAANVDNRWDARECKQILAACDRRDAETRELREMAIEAGEKLKKESEK